MEKCHLYREKAIYFLPKNILKRQFIYEKKNINYSEKLKSQVNIPRFYFRKGKTK